MLLAVLQLKNINKMRINVHASWISLYVSRILIAWWSGFKLLRKIFVFCYFYFSSFSENLLNIEFFTKTQHPIHNHYNGSHKTFPQKKHFTQKCFCRCAQKIVSPRTSLSSENSSINHCNMHVWKAIIFSWCQDRLSLSCNAMPISLS